MKRHLDDASQDQVPALLDRVYESFGLANAGVARVDFDADPALHLRNLSRRLRAGAEAGIQVGLSANAVRVRRGPREQNDE